MAVLASVPVSRARLRIPGQQTPLSPILSAITARMSLAVIGRSRRQATSARNLYQRSVASLSGCLASMPVSSLATAQCDLVLGGRGAGLDGLGLWAAAGPNPDPVRLRQVHRRLPMRG